MILDPGQFGCASKLPLNELLDLASLGDGVADFSLTTLPGLSVHSIDRVFRCSMDWDAFAEIALNHVLGDIRVSGANPIQVMFAFEFGVDAVGQERKVATTAFFKAASAMGCEVGKCHSSRAAGPTSVTVAAYGVHPKYLTRRGGIPAARGSVYISRPLGAAKLHFLYEMGLYSSPTPQQVLRSPPSPSFVSGAPWVALTDVSGDGLAGALLSVCSRASLDVTAILSDEAVFGPEVIEDEVDCLLNPAESYSNLPILASSPKAWKLARLRETAGPFVGFVDDDQALGEALVKQGAIRIGSFASGTGKVEIGWGN